MLYLLGLSSNDFGPALEQFLGTSAGLSGPVTTRFTAQWQDEAKAFHGRDLSGVDDVYVGRRDPRQRGSKAAGLAMAFKLIEAAQQRWGNYGQQV